MRDPLCLIGYRPLHDEWARTFCILGPVWEYLGVQTDYLSSSCPGRALTVVS